MVFGLRRAQRIALRYISHYGIYRHDLKVHHPPKQTTKLWRLPAHRKLVYVSAGWFYRKSSEDEAVKTIVSSVTFSKSGSHKLLESLSTEEFEALMSNKDVILEQFSNAEKRKAQEESLDVASQHISRY